MPTKPLAAAAGPSLSAAALALLVLVAGTPAHAQGPAADEVVAELGEGFAADTIDVNGATLAYVRGGEGPAVLLLHGFPEDWSEFRHVMPRLAERFTVVAADLRGIGGSAVSQGGYDAATLAEDARRLAEELGLDDVYLVGHDLGGIAAYAFVRLYPEATRGAMILDVPLPSTAVWQQILGDPGLWHIGLHREPELPEQLIAGREEVYVRHFLETYTLDEDAVDEADIARYAEAYSEPEQLHALLEIYRAMPMDDRFTALAPGATEVPLVLAGGDHAFGPLLPAIAEELTVQGWQTVAVELIEQSNHYVLDEQPAAVADLIERYASP